MNMGHLTGSYFISVLLFNDFWGTFFFFYILQNRFSLLQSGEAWHGILLMSSHLHLLSEQSGNYGNRQGQHSSIEFECRQMQSLWSRKCCKAELSLSAWPCSNHSAHSNVYFKATRCIGYIHYCTFLCAFFYPCLFFFLLKAGDIYNLDLGRSTHISIFTVSFSGIQRPTHSLGLTRLSQTII